MEKLVVLDYSTCTLHVYNIETEESVSDEYIVNLGYNPDACYWMIGDVEILYHKGILK